jgi:hypothetical protein
MRKIEATDNIPFDMGIFESGMLFTTACVVVDVLEDQLNHRKLGDCKPEELQAGVRFKEELEVIRGLLADTDPVGERMKFTLTGAQVQTMTTALRTASGQINPKIDLIPPELYMEFLNGIAEFGANIRAFCEAAD